MKIRKEEFERSEEQPALELFWQGIRSEETKEKYTRTLKRILCDILEEFFEGSFEQRADKIVKMAKEEPEWVRDLLLNISKMLRERTKLPKEHDDYLSPSSIANIFKPIKKLFDMNDVTFSWEKLYTTFPEIDNIIQTRGWTREEIQKMLNYANGAIDRAIVLIAASSGIRSGGLNLNWEDVVPIYKVDDKIKLEITEPEKEKAKIVCGRLSVYCGSSSQYPAFITAEAYQALQDYKQVWIREIGHVPDPKEPIFKKEGQILKRASVASIKKRVERMAQKAGFRPALEKWQRRYDVPTMNGFRRFCNKTCKEGLSKDSPLASLIKKEFMMGHVGLVKLDRNYFKTNVTELVEEYLSVAHDLTISDEYRLKIENRQLRESKKRYENSDVFKRLEKRLAESEKEIEEIKYGPKGRAARYARGMLNNDIPEEKKILGKALVALFELGLPEDKKRAFLKGLEQVC
ncbi:MAG TPA: integrase [Nitrosopumilaceae archaeon]|nr:integrase [Nitrosopumilaceae archaeon]